jgi:hypothetical protein
MKQKITLSVIFAALVLFSSFIPGSFSRFQLYPTACDLFVENNTDVNLASADFVSNIDYVTLSNIAPKGGTLAGRLQFDNADPVTILLTFSAPLSGETIALIYNNGTNNLVGKISFTVGATSGAIRIYPPIGSDAFIVRVYSK